VLDSNISISDVDLNSSNYNGATLTLARTTAANADDVFSSTVFSGTNIIVSSTTIGTFTQSGGTLVLTFNNSATQALVNSALQSIAYSNNSNNPDTSVQIDWTFNDGNSGAQGGGGALSSVGSTTVTITPVVDVVTSNGNTAFVEGQNVPSTAVVIDSALVIDNSTAIPTGNAPIVVTLNTDDGSGITVGSLSWAIQQANATAGLDTIRLDTDVTLSYGAGIILANSAINSDVIIDGQNYFVSGGNVRSLFYVYGGNDTGISIPASNDKGANNEIDVTFTNLTLKDGFARGGDGYEGGSGAGMGGALFVYQGNINIDNVTFSHNQAIGGRQFFIIQMGKNHNF
jgi:hypothetical protein